MTKQFCCSIINIGCKNRITALYHYLERNIKMKAKKIIRNITAIALSLTLFSTGTALQAHAWCDHMWMFSHNVSPHCNMYYCCRCNAYITRQVTTCQWEKIGTYTTVDGDYVVCYSNYRCYLCGAFHQVREWSFHK